MLRFFLLAICLTAVAGLGMLIDTASEPQTRRADPVPVGPETPIYAAGRIEALSEEIEVRPQLAGLIVRMNVAEGDVVEAGNVLFELDSAEYAQQLALAQAQLASAQARLARLEHGTRVEEIAEASALYQAKLAELERAQVSLSRIEQLQIQDAATQQQTDDERAMVKTLQAQANAAQARLDLLKAGTRAEDLAAARADVAAAKARVGAAEVLLGRTRVVAPARGRVLQVNSEVGELASPESALPVLVLADTSRYRVRAYVEELDAPRVTAGMRASVTADGMPGKILIGRVTRLSPRMGNKQLFTDSPSEHYDVKTREVWIELEPADEELVVGLRVDVVLKCAGERKGEE